MSVDDSNSIIMYAITVHFPPISIITNSLSTSAIKSFSAGMVLYAIAIWSTSGRVLDTKV